MRWILMFKRREERGNVRIYRGAECAENELPAAKEMIAMELERSSGEIWICQVIVPVAGETP